MIYNYEDAKPGQNSAGNTPPETRNDVPGDVPVYPARDGDSRYYQYPGPPAEAEPAAAKPDPAVPPAETNPAPPAAASYMSAYTPQRNSAAESRPYSEPRYSELAETRQAYTPGLAQAPFFNPPKREMEEEADREPKPKKPRGSGAVIRMVCLVLVCAIVGAASGIFGVRIAVMLGILTPEEIAISTGARLELAAEDLYDMARSQVVSIMSDVEQRTIFGTQSGTVSGSGFIISEDGYIITNYHVIHDAIMTGADINVVGHDSTVYKARVVGHEEENDLAVLKIDARGLSPVMIGSSANMRVGERVYAVGNPRRLDYTMTDGIVSAVGRTVQVEEASGRGYVTIGMFQISAAVNYGNSGGPVYNARGEVIGVVSAKYASEGAEGLGFAIPIDDAVAIATDLIEHGYVLGRPSIGVTVQTNDSLAARRDNTVEGALVISVNSDSAADRAGILEGDIITALDRHPVTSVDTLRAAKRHYSAGDTANISVFRDGETLVLTITFDEDRSAAMN